MIRRPDRACQGTGGAGSAPAQVAISPAAIAIGLTVVLLGFFGGLVMSAIKRDAGVKDYGNLIGGHGGMMDRIDSITFAAPVFFHVVRYFYKA